MKRKFCLFAITAALFLCLNFALEAHAYAYTDPGSSLLVYQSLTAIFTGGLFYFRRRLKSLLQRTPKQPPVQTSVRVGCEPR